MDPANKLNAAFNPNLQFHLLHFLQSLTNDTQRVASFSGVQGEIQRMRSAGVSTCIIYTYVHTSVQMLYLQNKLDFQQTHPHILSILQLLFEDTAVAKSVLIQLIAYCANAVKGAHPATKTYVTELAESVTKTE